MSDRSPPPSDPLGQTTIPSTSAGADPRRERLPALTVLGHGQASRIGERSPLFDLATGKPVLLSRLTPLFGPPGGQASNPLGDPFMSRNPLASLSARDGLIRLRRESAATLLRVDGADVAEERALTAADLAAGVVIELGGRAVLLLHLVEIVRQQRSPRFDLIGDSDAMDRLRRDIAKIAPTRLRVLIRGETGSGKELAARALHAASERATKPYVPVNMGAVPPALAASALFGHVRGAFTGAVTDHDGHFAAADGGTLFLDEIGEADAAVQAMLLRVLETGEVQRVGEQKVRKVDVRLVSATDADLETAVAAGRFREPLLHRIAESTLRVPSLGDRRDDIGRLVLHFLRESLNAGEQARLLDGPIAERPWLSSAVMARVARAAWTGNVRQVRNVVFQLAASGRGEPELAPGPDIESLLGAGASEAGASVAPESKDGAHARSESGRGPVRRPKDLTETEILETLEKSGWRRSVAASLLGISRSSLYTLLDANPGLVRLRDLDGGAIKAALDRQRGDLERAAAELRISPHGLKLRMQSLGLTRDRS